MIVKVGSKNAAKVTAVVEILQEYAHLKDAQVEGVEVSSEVPSQPKSLEETIRGARNRARNAFHDCDYSVGIESGLTEVPYSKSGYMDVCVAAIYDGTEYYLGLSSGWEFKDPRVFRTIIEGDKEMTDVLVELGLATDRSHREGNGAVGFATNGRTDRKAFTKEALRAALIHLDK